MLLNRIRKILVNKGIIPDNDKDTYSVKCPFHNEVNGFSLSISFKRKTFFCFSGKCGVHGNLQQLCGLLGEEVYTDNRYRYKHIVTHYTAEMTNLINEDEIEEFDLATAQQYHTKENYYLLERKISREVIEKNKCSFSNYFMRSYIPFFESGKCYGIVGRTVVGYDRLAIEFGHLQISLNKEVLMEKILSGEYESDFTKRTKFWIRYYNSYGLQKDKLVYEPLSNEKDNPIVLVTEGQINSLTANTMGYNAYSILGSYPNKLQVAKILHKSEGKRLILAFDNDESGIKNTHLFRQIAGKMIERIDFTKLSSKVNDLNEATFKQVYYLINNTTLM